jgi:hypothetical protein
MSIHQKDLWGAQRNLRSRDFPNFRHLTNLILEILGTKFLYFS